MIFALGLDILFKNLNFIENSITLGDMYLLLGHPVRPMSTSNHADIPVSRSLQVSLCVPERAWTRQSDEMAAELQFE